MKRNQTDLVEIYFHDGKNYYRRDLYLFKQLAEAAMFPSFTSRIFQTSLVNFQITRKLLNMF